MKIVAGASIVTVVLAATLLGQAPTFKSSTRTVPLYTTVIDAQGRLVPDLMKEDFDILDENKPQEIDLFINEVQPITVVVMLDTSASMTGNLKLLTLAAEAFRMRLLPEDQGRVGAFNDKIQFASEFTSNRDSLIGALKDLDFGNPTRLYDAIDASITELQEFEGRRVVSSLRTGTIPAAGAGSGDVLDRAREKEVMIYEIGLQTDYFNGVQRVRTKPDRSLRKLADETGGG